MCGQPVGDYCHQLDTAQLRRVCITFWKSRFKETAMQQQSGTMNQEKVEDASGLQIFFRSWRPAGEARGAIVVVPGFNSHSGHYGWVAEQLAAIGLAVYALDLRGR